MNLQCSELSHVADAEAPAPPASSQRSVTTPNSSLPWGLSTAVDLYQCNSRTIRDTGEIKRFVVELCDLIQMKRYGDCQVVHFGEGRVAGYSMTQLIETSLISGHFANDTNAAYLDIFSCKPYDPEIVERFAKTFFGALASARMIIQRR
jgi:S-adenosylmethionine/arginine decarboxylase-like enzyme